jgi:hypothetical protein
MGTIFFKVVHPDVPCHLEELFHIVELDQMALVVGG